MILKRFGPVFIRDQRTVDEAVLIGTFDLPIDGLPGLARLVAGEEGAPIIKVEKTWKVAGGHETCQSYYHVEKARTRNQ